MAKLVLTMEGSKYQAVKGKYADSKFMKISRYPVLAGPYIRELADQVDNA